MLARIIVVAILTGIMSAFDMTRAWTIPFFVIALAAVFVIEGVRVVPQQSAWIVELWPSRCALPGTIRNSPWTA
ncbi:MAG: hypothetical protein HYU75_08055 [Betaproteobacteria bacterium]|nr:hypothetical protein [Betaproteobacteria bacterium]